MLRIKPMKSATEMLADYNARLDDVESSAAQLTSAFISLLSREQAENLLAVLGGHFVSFDPGPKAVRYVLERKVRSLDAFSAMETMLSWSPFTPFNVQDFVNAANFARTRYEQAQREGQKAR